jgi:uncharacterized membrane protein YdjX (TVP38/TMEM64 family)
MASDLEVERVAGVPAGTRPRLRRWQVLALAGLVVAAVALARTYRIDQQLRPDLIRAWIAPYGAWGVLVFSAVKLVSMLLVMPLMPFSVAAGLLFGFGWGFVITVVTNMVGSTMAFALARRLGGDTIRSRLSGRWAAFDRAIGANGFTFLFFLRLTPLFPWNGVSYAVAVTSLGWRDFLLGTFVGMMPTTLVYSYAGAAAGDASLGKMAVALTLLAAMSLIPAWWRRRRQATPDQPEA